MHAFVNGLFRSSDETTARDLFEEVERLFAQRCIDSDGGRDRLAAAIAEEVFNRIEGESAKPSLDQLTSLIVRIFDYEATFRRSGCLV